MPKLQTGRSRPPAGFEIVEGTLEEFEARMREAELDDADGKRPEEALWPIFRIHWQRSRFVMDAFYKRKEISRALYEWLLREGYADDKLIAKWKKPGFEMLCCTRCVSTKNHNFETTCICRVPAKDLDGEATLQCNTCGCRGCSTDDVGQAIVREKKKKGGAAQRRRERRAAAKAAKAKAAAAGNETGGADAVPGDASAAAVAAPATTATAPPTHVHNPTAPPSAHSQEAAAASYWANLQASNPALYARYYSYYYGDAAGAYANTAPPSGAGTAAATPAAPATDADDDDDDDDEVDDPLALLG